MDALLMHAVTLRGGRLTLRPLTEDDWGPIHRWDTDAEVLYYCEGDDVQAYTLEESKDILRTVSQQAYMFMIELSGMPIGYCWLQRMNLERILTKVPTCDLRRIDIVIGEKTLWGQGIGTQVIGMLVRFGFEHEHADAICACGVADYNPRSRRAFEKNGFLELQAISLPKGRKAKVECDLMLTREAYLAARQAAVEVTPVPQEEQETLMRLLELYIHDFSEIVNADVNARGRYWDGVLDHYWTEAGRYPFFIKVKGVLAGFALVHRDAQGTFSIGEYFVMRKYRCHGVGKVAAQRLFDQFPGQWQVAQIAPNIDAQVFWRKVIGEYTAGQFTEVETQLSERWHGPMQQFVSTGGQGEAAG